MDDHRMLHLSSRSGNRSGKRGRTSEAKFSTYLVKILYWLVIIRLTVADTVYYGPDAKFLDIVARTAVFNKVTWVVFACVGAIYLISRLSKSLGLLKVSNSLFSLFIVYAAISVFWSIDVGVSTSRVIHVYIIFVCCMAVTLVGWHERRFQEVTRPIVTMLLLGSLIYGLVAPELAITSLGAQDPNSYWHGLTSQKNQLGSLASFGVLFWFHAWAARETKLWIASLWGGVALTCLILSHSSTSLMATVLVCLFLMLFLRASPVSRRLMPYLIGIFAIVTLLYTFAVLKVVPGLDLLLKPITYLTGKDTTFTSRTEIWDIIKAHIQLSPVLGSGYAAYWAGPLPTSPSYVFLQQMYFYPFEAHNGYLDVINDLGYVGLIVLLGYIWIYIRQSINFLKINYSQAGLYLAMLFQQLLTNLSESHWFFISHDFVILTLATLCLAAGLRAPRTLSSTNREKPLPPRSVKNRRVF